MTADYKPDFEFTKDFAHLAFTAELWGVYCSNSGENLSRYIGIALCVLCDTIAARESLDDIW